MSIEKNYHALLEDKIFMGGAADVKSLVLNEGVEVVVDLRGEATECAYPEGNVEWIQIPLADNGSGNQQDGILKAIEAVTEAYHANKKVAFHCGGGKGRTGAIAVGTLISLGISQTVDEAEAKAKSIRSVIDIKPSQKEALLKIYPNE